MDNLDELKFFDANCMIGRRVKKQSWEFDCIGNLQEEMTYFNIQEALVYHAVSREYDPGYGNDLLLKEIDGVANLHGVWVLTPDVQWHEADLHGFMKDMIHKGIKAVKLFPKTHGFILNHRTCGYLLEILQWHNVPVLIDLGETSWKEIDEIITRYPNIPFIVTQLSLWGDDRYFYPLLRDFKNIYIETSQYNIMGGLEAIRDKFGVDQLIFGTGLPVYAAGAPISLLLYSELFPDEKARIAYTNLKTLLERVKEG